jgi:hypothetical protein
MSFVIRVQVVELGVVGQADTVILEIDSKKGQNAGQAITLAQKAVKLVQLGGDNS